VEHVKFLEEGLDGLPIAHIEAFETDTFRILDACCVKPLCRATCRNHFCPGASKALGDGQPNAAGSAGNEDGFAGKRLG